MLLSRFRTLSEYGTYSQITLVVNIVATLCLLGLPNAINYFYPRLDTLQERKKFLGTFFTLNTLLSAIAGVLMVALIPFLTGYFKNNAIISFAYVCALLPWTHITIQERTHLFVAAGKTYRLIAHTLLNSIALLGIIVLMRLTNQTFRVYMVCYIAVEVLFSLFIYIDSSRLTKGYPLGIDKVLLKNILVYSIPIGLSDMVSTITKEVDKLMIGGFLSTEAVAVYTNAAREIPITIISSSFIAVIILGFIVILVLSVAVYSNILICSPYIMN